MAELAIVIPAYKGAYLSKTLESLACQTNKNFAVYIGNDGGETDIEKIVLGFTNRLNITYQSFKDNLGGISLVKQWERCFALTQQEEWLWLLPDDDYADSECVELFYRYLEKHDFDVFRFNVQFVESNGTVFKTNAALSGVQAAFDNLIEKLSFSRPSTVAEFIFNRQQFDQTGFTEIPMAWGTDDILWFSMGKEKGIHGCNDAYVYLRQSHLNISNNYTSLAKKKIEANFIFFEKLIQTETFAIELKDKFKQQQFAATAQQYIMYNLQDFSLQLLLPEMYKYGVKGNKIWGGGVLRNTRRFWLNNQRISKKMRDKPNG